MKRNKKEWLGKTKPNEQNLLTEISNSNNNPAFGMRPLAFVSLSIDDIFTSQQKGQDSNGLYQSLLEVCQWVSYVNVSHSIRICIQTHILSLSLSLGFMSQCCCDTSVHQTHWLTASTLHAAHLIGAGSLIIINPSAALCSCLCDQLCKPTVSIIETLSCYSPGDLYSFHQSLPARVRLRESSVIEIVLCAVQRACSSNLYEGERRKVRNICFSS